MDLREYLLPILAAVAGYFLNRLRVNLPWLPKPADPKDPSNPIPALDLEAILKALLDKLLPKVIEEARDAARQQVIESLPAKRKR